MASRQGRSNRIYNWHVFPFQLDAQISIGSSGAPTLVTSSAITGSVPAATTQQSQGIKSITRLTTGTYRIQLEDNYVSLLDFRAIFTAPLGSTINMGSLSTGTVYQILTMGTSTQAQFVTAGVPSGITAAVGVVFKAAGAGAGNGTVKQISVNAASNVQLLGGGPDLMLNSQPFTQGNGGGYITFQTLGHAFTGSALGTHTHTLTPAGTNDSSTPPIFTGTPGTTSATSAGTPAGTIATVAVDPSASTTMYLRILLSNSSIG